MKLSFTYILHKLDVLTILPVLFLSFLKKTKRKWAMTYIYDLAMSRPRFSVILLKEAARLL